MTNNKPISKRKPGKAVIGLVLALLLAVPVLALILDITADDSYGTVNDAVFFHYIIDGSGGTGVLNSFLRIQQDGSELGYNTDGALEFDTKGGGATKSIKLSQVPQVTLNGVTYRAFVLDLNEANDPIDLTELQLFTAATGNLTGYNAGGPDIGGATTLVYNLDSNEDNTVQLEMKDSGSGRTDYVVYIPDSLFAGGPDCDFGDPDAGCLLYVYLYSNFNLTDGGFEEWSVATELGVVPTPSPTPTSTATNTATSTSTSTPTDTPTTTNTPTTTSTPTQTPTPTTTSTPTQTPTPTTTSTPTNTPPPSGICLPGAGASEMTTILGKGMGSNNKASGVVKIVVPNNNDVISIYGQLAGKEQGKYKYARFIRPNGTYINDKTKESQAYRSFAVFWYGQDLTPANSANWRARLIGASTAKPYVQRAFLLYPTYRTSSEYVNVVELFDNSSRNHVYWEVLNGWIPTQIEQITIPAPLQPVDLVVTVAVVDNDLDTRPFKLTITAGGVSQSVQVNGPTHGDLLNIIQVTLANVPAGTSTVELELESPDLIGDSVAMVGMTAHYPCVP